MASMQAIVLLLQKSANSCSKHDLQPSHKICFIRKLALEPKNKMAELKPCQK